MVHRWWLAQVRARLVFRQHTGMVLVYWLRTASEPEWFTRQRKTALKLGAINTETLSDVSR